MARNPIQDIVPNSNRSIRNIPLTKKSVRPLPPVAKPISRPAPKEEQEEIEEVQEEVSDERETLRAVRDQFEGRSARYAARSTDDNGRSFKWAIIIGIVAVVIGLAWLVSSVFHSATLTVTPRTLPITLNENLVAKKSATTAELPFTVLAVEEVGSQVVDAKGEEKVDKAASGTIVIYNNYSTAAQKLLRNTRFETPEGLIFKITESVSVPGKKGTTPGSIEATVMAEATGDKYNVGLKDFTIPGFKNDPQRSTTIYARSKTPLQGGFTGTVKIVADADRTKAQDEIAAKAGVSLLQQINSTKPADTVFFDRAYKISCVALPQETVSDKEARISSKCSVSAALFSVDALSSYLAKKYVTGYAGEPVAIQGIENLTFTPKVDFDPAATSVSFGLSGSGIFEWIYDEVALKTALAGKTKADVASVISEFPMIEKADISISPAWRRVFPAEIADISVEKVVAPVK